MALSKFAKLLRNRYYLGVVTYRGVEYPGKHPALVSAELFARVQRILDERDQHALKLRVNRHYLRGLLTCRRCGGRLLYTLVRGKAGGEFAYYVCPNRHHGTTCDLPYLPALDVEDRLTRAWPAVARLDLVDAEAVGHDLRAVLGDEDQGRSELVRHTQRRLARLDNERRKLVQMAYADAIPLDLLKVEQDRIRRERDQADRELAEAEQSGAQVQTAYQQAAALMQRAAEIYALADDDVRRQLNQAFMAVIEVDTDEERVTLGSPWREISSAASHVRQHGTRPPNQASEARAASWDRATKNPDLVFAGQGSNMNPLVEPRGLEPLTPTLPVR